MSTTIDVHDSTGYSHRMSRYGNAQAEHIIARLMQLAREIDDYSVRHCPDDDETHPARVLGWTLDGLMDAAMTELPSLALPAQFEEACAAFACALFGPEVMAPPDSRGANSAAELAFRVGRAMLDEEPTGAPFFLIAAATTAAWRYRQQQKERGARTPA